MTRPPDPLARQRRADPTLAGLPREIDVPHRGATGHRTLEVDAATIDDVAFAMTGPARLTPRERGALEMLYWLAREAGCLGAAPAVAAALTCAGR